MPTPPVQRRNPTISIRRVQSERKYFSPWGSVLPCPIWKPQFEYARKTAIIPPRCTTFIGTAVGTYPHMLGTSQGVLGCHILRGIPTLQPLLPAHHPLIIVAPPLFVRGYSTPPHSKAKEEEFLAQERIASFLTEGAPPHKPRSLLSYPDSHLYESLISQLSDLNAEDISIENSKFDSDYLHIDSSPNCTIIRPKKSPIDSSGSYKFSTDSTKRETKQVSHCSDTVGENKDVKYKPHLQSKIKNLADSVSSPSRNTSFCKFNDKNLENNSHLRLTSNDIYKNERNLSRKLHDRLIHQNNVNTSSIIDKKYIPKSYISKPMLNEKKEISNESKLLPTQTVVSVVHVNKENGIDEVFFRESTCYKCGETAQRFHSASSDHNEIYEGPPRFPALKNRKIAATKKQKEILQNCNNLICKDGGSGSNWENTTEIPRTIELLESEPTSRQNSNISLAQEPSQKVITPVPLSSVDLRSFGSLSSKDSTLDPLKPLSLENTKKIEQPMPKAMINNVRRTSGGIAVAENGRHLKHSPPSFPEKVHCKGSDCIPPLTGNFNWEELSSNEGESHQLFSYDDEDDSDSIYSSILEFYSIATTRPDSFVYVYKSPSKSNWSNSQTSRTSTMSLRFNINQRKGTKSIQRTNESSGLGSSGSDNSFEDVSIKFPSSLSSSSLSRTNLDASFDSTSKSSVTFLEPSFSPTKYTSTPTSSRCSRLSFDYSCSWTDLNNLVKKSSTFKPLKHADICHNTISEKFLNRQDKYNFSSATFTKKALAL